MLHTRTGPGRPHGGQTTGLWSVLAKKGGEGVESKSSSTSKGTCTRDGIGWSRATPNANRPLHTGPVRIDQNGPLAVHCTPTTVVPTRHQLHREKGRREGGRATSMSPSRQFPGTSSPGMH